MRFDIAVVVVVVAWMAVVAVVVFVVVAVVVDWPFRVVYHLEDWYHQELLDCFVVVAVDSWAPILQR